MRILCLLALTMACQTAREAKAPLASPKAKQETAETYTRVFRELPLAASLTKLPWPSESWSTVHGGAAFRWQPAKKEGLEDIDDLRPFIHYNLGPSADISSLSPVEKLDLVAGNSNWDFTRRERERTLAQKRADGLPRNEIPEWEGIMHAWSTAALQFDPVAPVTLKSKDGRDIPFEKEDIHSLLSLYVHEQAPRVNVLASICEGEELGTRAAAYAFENEKQTLRSKACPKLDAGTFHVVLANQIGKRNEGFVMDRDNQGEIQSNPVVAYESRVIEKPGSPKSGTRDVQLRTVVFLTAELPVLTADPEDETYPYETEIYEYSLRIDPNGKILSGQWLDTKDSEFNASIPDFLWKASPVWLQGPLKSIYEKARNALAEVRAPKQLRPIEDMPVPERKALNSYFNAKGQEAVNF